CTAERGRRADVQALMGRVRMVVHPEQTTRACLATQFSEVTVALADGRRLTRRGSVAKGQPKNPLSDAEITAKFRDCAGRGLSAERGGGVVEALGRLGRAEDVGALARLLAVRAD